MGLQSQPITAVAGSAGIANAVLPTVPLGQTWVVSQITVATNSANQTTASISYSGSPVDNTDAGNADTCAGDPPVEVTQKDNLIVTWTGCNAGDLCTATFYYAFKEKNASPG